MPTPEILGRIGETAIDPTPSSDVLPLTGELTKDDFSPQIKKATINNPTFVNPSSFVLSDNSTLIWVVMTGLPVYKLTNNVRAPAAFTNINETTKGLAVSLNTKSYTFKFLASLEMVENVAHSWEPYESMASNAAQMFASFGISTPEQLRGVMSSLGAQTLEQLLSMGWDKIKEVVNRPGSILNNIYQGGLNALSAVSKSGTVANYRVDTPLQYKGSERRSFELVFNLVNTKKGMNREEVVVPVKLLEMLSSPSFSNEDNQANSDIILPYLFEVNTMPGDLLTMDFAVLKAVNPTWKGPWIDGYPSRCELRLSFMDYRPLEQRVFFGAGTKDKRIQAVYKERPDAKTNLEENLRPTNRDVGYLDRNY